MNIIPFKEPGSWQSQNTFTNVIFLIQFKWNALNKYWIMSIYDRNNNPILLGVKVVTNFNLTSQFAAITGMPSGNIICQNILDMWNDIERFDMGETNELIYFEPGVLESYEISP